MSSEKKCCVPGCHGNSDAHTVLHLFPNPATEMDRFMSWVFNIGGDILKYSNEYIYKNLRVCHAHFELKYSYHYNQINKFAVPTLHLPDKGILPVKYQGTADLLLLFDELFDSDNGSYANRKKAKPLLQSVKPNSAHHKKWTEFKKILKTMKFYKADVMENVPTLNNWVWTLEGIKN